MVSPLPSTTVCRIHCQSFCQASALPSAPCAGSSGVGIGPGWGLRSTGLGLCSSQPPSWPQFLPPQLFASVVSGMVSLAGHFHVAPCGFTDLVCTEMFLVCTRAHSHMYINTQLEDRGSPFCRWFIDAPPVLRTAHSRHPADTC